MYKNIEELKSACKGIIDFSSDRVKILNQQKLRDNLIDQLIYTAVFTQDAELKNFLYRLIRTAAIDGGVVPESIHGLYDAASKGVYSHKTVPAINIRGLAYDVARAIFRAAIKNKVGAFIFEIARSEIDYTAQRPSEYAGCILAAAIKEGYKGPVFIQGDHFQANAKKFQANPAEEINNLKNLIKEALDAGFYNIDIDASTLVDLSKSSIKEQQENNGRNTAELTNFIRGNQPKGIMVTIGGEIGEVGKQNSRPEELRAFMENYNSYLPKGLAGLSKISVQTGTTHGGIALPDGSIAQVKLDFNTLKTLSEIAKSEFKMAGAVQHGASTLPDDAFDKFPETNTAEVHLATGFQNIIYDHPDFPKDLRQQIETHLKDKHLSEKKPEQTDEQFIYNTRKKAFGVFKRQMWDISRNNLMTIMSTLEERFSLLFHKLNVQNTQDLTAKTVKSVVP